MASFPTSIVTTSSLTPVVGSNQTNAPSHATLHDNTSNEVIAIESTLGTNPQGSYSTVSAAITTLGTLATAAVATAASSLTIANTAQTTASTALVNASAAQTTATSAYVLATAAQSTASAIKTSLGSNHQGDVFIDTGAGITRLTPGTNGQFLQTQGAFANPQWATIYSILGVHATATQTVTTSSSAQRTFSTVDKDSGGYWASNTYTPLVAGWYSCSYNDSFASPNSTVDYSISIYKNGSPLVTQKCTTPSLAGNMLVPLSISSALVQCNGSTDNIQFFVSNGSGSLSAVFQANAYASIIRVF